MTPMEFTVSKILEQVRRMTDEPPCAPSPSGTDYLQGKLAAYQEMHSFLTMGGVIPSEVEEDRKLWGENVQEYYVVTKGDGHFLVFDDAGQRSYRYLIGATNATRYESKDRAIDVANTVNGRVVKVTVIQSDVEATYTGNWD